MNSDNKEEKIKFNCKICYDLVNEPIVTHCGHLYCWNCIYFWYKEKNKSIIPCPLCNSEVDIQKVIPIYVSEEEHKKKYKIPNRPNPKNSSFYNNNNNVFINLLGFNFNININELSNINRNRLYYFILILLFIFILMPILTFFLDYIYYENYINDYYDIEKSIIRTFPYYKENNSQNLFLNYIPFIVILLIVSLIFTICYFKNNLRQRIFN